MCCLICRDGTATRIRHLSSINLNYYTTLSKLTPVTTLSFFSRVCPKISFCNFHQILRSLPRCHAPRRPCLVRTEDHDARSVCVNVSCELSWSKSRNSLFVCSELNKERNETWEDENMKSLLLYVCFAKEYVEYRMYRREILLSLFLFSPNLLWVLYSARMSQSTYFPGCKLLPMFGSNSIFRIIKNWLLR